jgi:hypothetical protein
MRAIQQRPYHAEFGAARDLPGVVPWRPSHHVPSSGTCGETAARVSPGLVDDSLAFRIGGSNRDHLVVSPSRRELPELNDYWDGELGLRHGEDRGPFCGGGVANVAP